MGLILLLQSSSLRNWGCPLALGRSMVIYPSAERALILVGEGGFDCRCCFGMVVVELRSVRGRCIFLRGGLLVSWCVEWTCGHRICRSDMFSGN